jgi:prenylcysteine oxidase/farnesylcysteine lyase
MLFDAGYEVVALQEWTGAYPKFDPPENFPKFELSTGLYYANALENAASAMEMAAISSKNVALLAAQYLSKKSKCSKERETPSINIDGKSISSISSGVELYRGGYKRDAAAAVVAAAAAA